MHTDLDKINRNTPDEKSNQSKLNELSSATVCVWSVMRGASDSDKMPGQLQMAIKTAEEPFQMILETKKWIKKEFASRISQHNQSDSFSCSSISSSRRQILAEYFQRIHLPEPRYLILVESMSKTIPIPWFFHKIRECLVASRIIFRLSWT